MRKIKDGLQSQTFSSLKLTDLIDPIGKQVANCAWLSLINTLQPLIRTAVLKVLYSSFGGPWTNFYLFMLSTPLSSKFLVGVRLPCSWPVEVAHFYPSGLSKSLFFFAAGWPPWPLCAIWRRPSWMNYDWSDKFSSNNGHATMFD